MDVGDVVLAMVISRMVEPAWHADAACREHPELDYFPGRGIDAAPLKTVCATCLVRDECLQSALDNGDTHGIWGGLSERERRRIRRRHITVSAA